MLNDYKKHTYNIKIGTTEYKRLHITRFSSGGFLGEHVISFADKKGEEQLDYKKAIQGLINKIQARIETAIKEYKKDECFYYSKVKRDLIELGCWVN